MLGKRSRRDRRRLEERGIVAMAEILEATGSVWTINHRGATRDANNSEWAQRVRLRVEPAGAEPFETECRLRFPFGAAPQKGVRIAVRYDPDDTTTLEYTDDVPADASREDRERAVYRTMRAQGASLDDVIRVLGEQRRQDG